MPLFLAAALAAVQPSAAPPLPVALHIAAMGGDEDRAGLSRLLFEVWNPRGNLRAVAHRGPGRWSRCVTLGANVQIDAECVRRRLPRRRDGLPVVALIIAPSSGVYRHILHCIGPGGAGRRHVASFPAIPQPGVMSRQKNNDRTAVGSCIDSAAPGSVTGSLW